MQNISSYNYKYDENTAYQNGEYTYFYKNKKSGYLGSCKKPTFQVGSEVYHSRYGYGKVIAVNTDSARVTFNDGNVKTILSEYLESA